MKKWLVFLSILVLLPILLLFFSYLIIPIIFIGLLYLRPNYATIKGAVGESRVNRILTSLGSDYTVFHDIYIPSRDGETTQIDHIVTSRFGIFIIETKHYSGWIFGEEHQRYWTQVIYKRKEKLFNPIWQNYGHVQALKNFIGKDNDGIVHSIIAFSPDSTLKFSDNFKDARVIQFPQLVKVISEWKVHCLSEFELRKINRTLESLVVHDKKAKREIRSKHIERVNQNRKERLLKEKESIERSICPRCSGDLTLRAGKYGSFYGCNNFPKCRFTMKA